VRVQLGTDVSLATGLRALQETERPFALVGRWAGGGALLGCDPIRTATSMDDPFELLASAEQDSDDSHAGVSGVGVGGPGGPVGGGWIGYIGYPARVAVHRGHPSPPRAQPLPPSSLAYYDNLVRLDVDGSWWFEALPSAGRSTELERRVRWWTERLTSSQPARTVRTDGWHLTPSAGAHAELVAACRERIHAGDLFQANICAQLVGRFKGDPLELFIRGVESLEPDWAAYLQSPSGTVVSLSPELFLQRQGRELRSAPIKGTRPRPADPARAAAEHAALAHSEKDRAENVMIVDLIRSDLGRVCVPGTIAAGPVAQVQAHAGVWHLVSEVRGRLRADIDDGQLLRATFPPGSVTGAPKIAAMNVIAELESTEREVYTGAVGIASPLSGLALNVAIRTFEIVGSSIRLGVGGGVVADSDPIAEATELATKVAPLLEAIGAPRARFTTSDARFVPVHRFGPFPVPRPDPRSGVYETLLVQDGKVIRLDAHLARVALAVRELYGHELPASTADRLTAAAAATPGSARMRVDVMPAHGSLDLTVMTSALEHTVPVGLRVWCVPGGLGAHKWIDHRLIDALQSASGDDLPLLVDADGYVLETSRASVFMLASGGVLRTPPDDGRILPGISRARVLEYGHAGGLQISTEPLALEELASAQAVVLTSALRRTPVTALDRRELGQRPELLALLETALA
jgi:para-aminobenzoate synthetase/4-amino-4-deoxychorismate lyase